MIITYLSFNETRNLSDRVNKNLINHPGVDLLHFLSSPNATRENQGQQPAKNEQDSEAPQINNINELIKKMCKNDDCRSFENI
jgi:hypothetical protein